MHRSAIHSFHIPVLGLGFSIDTPVKVARFGISSVISIMDDQLIERMRGYYCLKSGTPYTPIPEQEEDHRAMRITAYLNLVNDMVSQQMMELRKLPFAQPNALLQYFELLPETSPLKQQYRKMEAAIDGAVKEALRDGLRSEIVAGSIDVNIMAKVDRTNMDDAGNPLPAEYSDAMAALRGFANSDLRSSVVFSAGYNPRLFNYVEQFPDFFPDDNGLLKKKIILKVSDYRSALVQGKIFAKKGLWISEFRIESGLNCGGHAFATDGLLLGPILEEFKNRRAELITELFELWSAANALKNCNSYAEVPEMKITVQGGIGTAHEDNFLLEYYGMDGTGWGSPFLLVPEATNVDALTINELATAKKEDYFISAASPLGVPFNNFRRSSSETQRKNRIVKGRPGSPCFKKFLSADTEFTSTSICTGSREYQDNKIRQLREKRLPPDLYQIEFNKITEKDCLCEGLGAAVLVKNEVPLSHKLSAVAICPGPNLAYFSGIHTLAEMVGHIYGRLNLLNSLYRPNMFVNELHLYIDYLRKKVETGLLPDQKQQKYLRTFKSNLVAGIDYYKALATRLKDESIQYIASMNSELDAAACVLLSIMPDGQL